jgi:hypothetical protein
VLLSDQAAQFRGLSWVVPVRRWLASRAGAEQAERAANFAACVAFAGDLRRSIEAYFSMGSPVAELAAKNARESGKDPDGNVTPLSPFEVDTVESCTLLCGERSE